MLDFQTRKQQAIQITGVAPQQTVHMQLAKLRQEGILVDLNITGTGIFQRVPNWAELGIPEFTGDKRATQFTKGAKYLYPEEKVRAVKSFESRLRQNLDKYSFEVAGFRPFRWLPYTAYQAWRAKHDEIVAQANEFIQTQLIDCHDQCRDQIAATYKEIAEAAWLSATTGENAKGRRAQTYKFIILYDKTSREQLTLDHAGFVSYIVAQALAQIPGVEDIMNKLRYDYTTALVYGQEDVAADEANAENIRANVKFERERAMLENQFLAEKVRKQAWDNQTEQTQKEQILEAMRQAEYDHHRQQLQETVSPFVEVYRQAIGQFINHAKDMLESIQKNKHVRGKVAERGRGLLDVYNLLVLPGMGDDRMMEYLKDLRSLLGPADDTRNTEAI
ncbi:MAG: hypothetical protein PHQ36_12985, partial [Anaerolineales bacterium]|nr:hypothetical protein [Anaerolineales bacterium]